MQREDAVPEIPMFASLRNIWQNRLPNSNHASSRKSGRLEAAGKALKTKTRTGDVALRVLVLVDKKALSGGNLGAAFAIDVKIGSDQITDMAKASHAICVRDIF